MTDTVIRPGLLKRLSTDTSHNVMGGPPLIPKRKPLPKVPMDLDVPGIGACQWVSEAHEPASHWYVTQTPSGPAFVFVKTHKGALDWWAWAGQQDYSRTSFDHCCTNHDRHLSTGETL